MQKVEKWRIEELALVLSELSGLLRKGDNCEWANVFAHFNDESQKIISKKEFDTDSLNKLIVNIKNCFFVGGSLTNIDLWHENPEEKTRLNQSLSFTIAHLLKILTDMEKSIIEPIN